MFSSHVVIVSGRQKVDRVGVVPDHYNPQTFVYQTSFVDAALSFANILASSPRTMGFYWSYTLLL